MLVYACGVWYGGKCKGTHNLACYWVGGFSIVWIWEAILYTVATILSSVCMGHAIVLCS